MSGWVVESAQGDLVLIPRWSFASSHRLVDVKLVLAGLTKMTMPWMINIMRNGRQQPRFVPQLGTTRHLVVESAKE